MASNKLLEGKIAIVTGASRGLAAPLRCSWRRMAPRSSWLREPRPIWTKLRRKLFSGGKAISVAGDLRDPGVPGALVNAALEAYGAPSISS